MALACKILSLLFLVHQSVSDFRLARHTKRCSCQHLLLLPGSPPRGNLPPLPPPQNTRRPSAAKKKIIKPTLRNKVKGERNHPSHQGSNNNSSSTRETRSRRTLKQHILLLMFAMRMRFLKKMLPLQNHTTD